MHHRVICRFVVPKARLVGADVSGPHNSLSKRAALSWRRQMGLGSCSNGAEPFEPQRRPTARLPLADEGLYGPSASRTARGYIAAMRSLLYSFLIAAGLSLVAGSAVSATTVDGVSDGGGPLLGGSIANLKVLGRGGVPTNGVGSVALNVTITAPSAAGFMTVWPAGTARPEASNLNFVANQTVPNMVIVPVGVDGQISLYASSGATTDIIVDVLGWFPTTSSFTGLNPARLMDTRTGSGTIDGLNAGTGKVAADGVVSIQAAGRGGIPGVGVGSVALNVTVTAPQTPGFATIWPAGTDRPEASNLNFVTDQTVPNMVIVPLGTDGKISLVSSATTDVLIDVLGWFSTDSGFTGLRPARLVDSRSTGATVDGRFARLGKVARDLPTVIQASGRGGIPLADVGSVALNVTIVSPSNAGFATVWPTGLAQPNASNLNFVAGQVVPNMVIVPVSPQGQISLASSADATDVIVDVLGWFPTGNGFVGLTPARLMDSRKPAPPPPVAVQTFSSGTHLVNQTIPAGRYVAENAPAGCYWERLSGLGGSFGEILANDFRGYTGRVVVDIRPTDVAFSFHNCNSFKTYVAPAATSAAIVPGTHVVGAHIAAGRYFASAQSNCYWERVSSLDGSFTSLITNDFISATGPQYVTIQPTDAGFTSNANCGTWMLA